MCVKASRTDVPDAPSGFRAYSRSTAMRMNVINEYTYTLETIVQAGRNKMAVTSVPIRTNPELRKSRLFHSMFGYVKKSMLTIGRAYMMYRPLPYSPLLPQFSEQQVSASASAIYTVDLTAKDREMYSH